MVGRVKLTKEQTIRLAFYGAYLTVLASIVIWFAFPQVRGWTRQGWEWARYYQWRASWAAMPPWEREAWEVRKAPAPGPL